jgi:hypothetical protein
MLTLFVLQIPLQLAKCFNARIFHCQIINMERVTKLNDSPFNTMYHVNDNWNIVAKVMPSLLFLLGPLLE